MIHIDSNGMISGGHMEAPAPVWYWAANTISPYILSTTVRGWNGGSILGNLSYIIEQPGTTGVGVFWWIGTPELTTPVNLDPRPAVRLHTAGLYWVAHDDISAWGMVYSGPLNVTGSTAVAVQDDGSYILLDNTTDIATVYWSDGTRLRLPAHLGEEWSLRGNHVFFESYAGMCLFDRERQLPLQRVTGAMYVPFQTIMLFGVPWVWYYHLKDTENNQDQGRAILHPYNDASRGFIINGSVYSSDVRQVGETVVIAWSEDPDEDMTTVRRHLISDLSQLRSFATSQIGPVSG